MESQESLILYCLSCLFFVFALGSPIKALIPANMDRSAPFGVGHGKLISLASSCWNFGIFENGLLTRGLLLPSPTSSFLFLPLFLWNHLI